MNWLQHWQLECMGQQHRQFGLARDICPKPINMRSVASQTAVMGLSDMQRHPFRRNRVYVTDRTLIFLTLHSIGRAVDLGQTVAPCLRCELLQLSVLAFHA
jgi:hypothetical protein